MSKHYLNFFIQGRLLEMMASLLNSILSFWPSVVKILAECLTRPMKEKRYLIHSGGVLSCSRKGGKDRICLENRRLISLAIVDAKIVSKEIATRIVRRILPAKNPQQPGRICFRSINRGMVGHISQKWYKLMTGDQEIDRCGCDFIDW